MTRFKIEIQLPKGEEKFGIGDILDTSFPNSTSRRSRVTKGDLSLTISSQNMSHIIYFDGFNEV